MPINSFIYPGAKVTTAYEVANSCKFDRASSAYMDKSSGTSSNNDIYTLSFWMKRAGLEISDNILFSIYKDANNRAKIGIGPADSGAARDHKLELYDWYGGSQILNQVVDVHLMDPSSWYHICIRVDTTQSTANDRIRVYINGVDQASNITRTTTPNQNQNLGFQETTASNQWRIGSHNGGGDYFDGYLAEVVYCDGQSYAPTQFGEFDDDSPTIWKPIKISGLTFGTNGFYLDFQDSSNLGNDANGGTDFAENNIVAADQATDTPQNNFCTMNPMDNYYTVNSFLEGNCTVTTASSGYTGAQATMGVAAGKWYFEFKPISKTGDGDEYAVGVVGEPFVGTGQSTWHPGTGYAYVGSNGGTYNNDAVDTSGYGSTYTAGDIIGVALDVTNSKLYWSKNGSWQNSGDPTSGSTGTGAEAITAVASTPTGFYTPSCAFVANAASATMGMNFGGCPPFAISSGNSDANGYGNFEYAVPSGYYAICTKNLAEYG